MSLTAWDVETTIRPRFKRTASPFGAGNWVVTHAFQKGPAAPVVEYRFGRRPPGPGWLRTVLEGTRLLAGFNIKFDLLHALQDPENLAAWMRYVADGGGIWDCQLAEYLLDGMDQRSHMLSLDEVAPRYGGGVKVDEVKLLWNAGVSTEDIEPGLLTRYLLGGKDEHGVWQPGDIQNTMRIAQGQIAKARECGQLRSILLNMGSLIASIEMERNGMFVNKAHGLELAAELKAEIDQLHTVMSGYLPADMPFQFNWNSRFHKSALFFGGMVKYPRREYQLRDGTFTFREDHPDQAYSQKDETHWIRADGTTHPVDPDYREARDGALARYAGGKNAGEVKTKQVKVDDLSKPKSRVGQDTYTFKGFTAPRKEWESSDPGVYSTSSEVIEELATSGVPFLRAFATLQKLTKDLGTYYITVDPETGEEKGMLSLVDEHGIIHHKINHTSTVTGRFSSSDPNLQNIPKGNKSKVKLLFVSRFKDGTIIQSDFSSLEIYVQAILTGCRQLIEDLLGGLDMHVVRLSTKERMPYAEVLKLAKGYTDETGVWHDPDPTWDYKRTGAKVFSFQRAYGAGAKKISDSAGIPLEDVEALIDADNERYPEIEPYYEDLTSKIKANRRPAGIVVPHPSVPGIMCNLGRSFYRTPDGKLYSYIESPSPEYLVKRGVFASFSPTEIKNYVVQGSGGEWMKAAMWLAVRAFYAVENFGGRALLVNTVHDAMYADADNSVRDDAAALLHACMEGASDLIEYWFGWTIPVPVPSDTSWGPSMMDEQKIPGIKERAAGYRQTIREAYMQSYTPSFIKKD